MRYNVSRSVPKYLKNKAEKVIKSLSTPFGTFEKAIYILYEYDKVLYKITTTIRSQSECIQVLKTKFCAKRKKKKNLYFSIYKHQAGKIIKIYSSQN